VYNGRPLLAKYVWHISAICSYLPAVELYSRTAMV